MQKPDYDEIAEVSGWNLANVEALNATLASAWALDLPLEAKPLVESAYAATLRAVAKVPGVKSAAAALGPLSAAASAWASVVSSVTEDMRETQRVNARRLFAARDLSIMNSYTLGDWWTLAEVVAPQNPQLVKPYRESLDDFEGQVAPRGFVFSAARGGGRRDVLRPSWPANPATPQDRAYAFGGENSLVNALPALAQGAMNDEVLDCGGEGDTSCDPGDFGDLPGWLQKAARWVCLPVDLSRGCSVPMRAWWTYCLGAAPCWGWQGQRFPFSPIAQTLAAAIRSPSIWHLAIPESRVRASLKAILERTGVLDLAEDPGQAADGIYRQRGGVRLVLRGEIARGWSPAARLGNPLLTPGEDLRVVIDSHLDWLALRWALLATLRHQRPELKAAAATSDDPAVRRALAGDFPPNYSRDDPLHLVSEERPAKPAKSTAKRPPSKGPGAAAAKVAGLDQPAKAKAIAWIRRYGPGAGVVFAAGIAALSVWRQRQVAPRGVYAQTYYFVRHLPGVDGDILAMLDALEASERRSEQLERQLERAVYDSGRWTATQITRAQIADWKQRGGKR